MDFTKFIVDNNYGEVVENASFKGLTYIGCGGDIKYLYFPNNVNSLANVFKYVNYYNFKYIVIGNASNILPSDDFFDGIVICLKLMERYIEVYDDYVVSSAFVKAPVLAKELSKIKMGDLSFMCGIPGLIGGLIRQNSGAYNDDISNHIICAKYINYNGEIEEIYKADMDFGYRDSIFQHIRGIIIEAKFKISKNICTKERIVSRNKRRKENQPLEYKNMGSVFKNNENISAWQIIDKLDLRGFNYNGAYISNKHTNFIINKDNAQSSDIIYLIDYIKSQAKEKFDIILETEIIIL